MKQNDSRLIFWGARQALRTFEANAAIALGIGSIRTPGAGIDRHVRVRRGHAERAHHIGFEQAGHVLGG